MNCFVFFPKMLGLNLKGILEFYWKTSLYISAHPYVPCTVNNTRYPTYGCITFSKHCSEKVKENSVCLQHIINQHNIFFLLGYIKCMHLPVGGYYTKSYPRNYCLFSNLVHSNFVQFP